MCDKCKQVNARAAGLLAQISPPEAAISCREAAEWLQPMAMALASLAVSVGGDVPGTAEGQTKAMALVDRFKSVIVPFLQGREIPDLHPHVRVEPSRN